MRRDFSKGFVRLQDRNRTESEADDAQVRRFKQILLDEVDLQELSRLPADERRARLERVLAHLISREGVILSTRERSTLVRRVVDEAVGLGVLEPLLADDSISEIMINGHDTVYVERFGRVERIPSGFTSEAQLLQTIDRIVSAVNRRVDESSPMVDARLPADARMPRGARVNVVLPPLSLTGPAVTIRLFPKAYGLADLLQRGTLDRESAELLSTCVRARLNIVVSGGTASGKTTMLNALSQFIPGRERIVTVEDAAELSLNQEHVIRLETRPPNVDGRGRGDHPRAGPQLAAYAARPDRRRRGPRRRGAGHAAGDEHRSRGFADHGARQQRLRRAVPDGDAGHDERRRGPLRRDPRPGQLGDPPDRAAEPARRRLPADRAAART